MLLSDLSLISCILQLTLADQHLLITGHTYKHGLDYYSSLSDGRDEGIGGWIMNSEEAGVLGHIGIGGRSNPLGL